MYKAITRNIQVTVTPRFLPEQSAPNRKRFLWSYAIEILNLSQERVQLLERHWQIADADGHTEEVRGPGVVGEQPVLEPGESFSYTSGVPLSTSSGLMVGTYNMVNDAGDQFEVAIPAFSLDMDDAPRTVH